MPGFRQYCLDTSAYIRLHAEFPKAVYVDLWPRIEWLVKEHRFVSPLEVKRELERNEGDKCCEWVKGRWDKLSDDDDAATVHTANTTPRIQDMIRNGSRSSSTRPWADPLVVALAYRKSISVVTFESVTGGKNKIPRVCTDLRVECLTLTDLFCKEGWTFRIAKTG